MRMSPDSAGRGPLPLYAAASEVRTKSAALPRPMPPLMKLRLLRARSLLNRLSEDAISERVLTWPVPPNTTPLRLSR